MTSQIPTAAMLAIILALGLVSAGLSLADPPPHSHGGGEDPPPPPPPTTFSIAFLPTDHFPFGMNDLGDVVGWSPTVFEFIWLAEDDTGVRQIVYENELDLPADVNPYRFYDINNFGQIVGLAWDGTRETYFAFRFTPGDGVNAPLLDFLADADNSGNGAISINDSGDVTGRIFDATTGHWAFRYTDTGGLVDIGTLGGSFAQASAINELGEINGQSSNTDGLFPFRATPGQSLLDLGSLCIKKGPCGGDAGGINDYGDVVGISGHDRVSRKGGGHAFLYTDAAGMRDLGTLSGHASSWALGINNTGVVVGWSKPVKNQPETIAFLYIDGTMYDLNELVVNLPGDCQLHAAEAINESNEICGTVRFADGTQGGFVLTPETP